MSLTPCFQHHKVYRLAAAGYVSKQGIHKRLASAASGSKGALRASRRVDVPGRAKRLVKNVADAWKRIEREDVERKKQLEREAYQKIKQDDENREAQRQAKKLEFLLTQTELYSHFVGNKGKGVSPVGFVQPGLRLDSLLDDGSQDDDDNEPAVDPTAVDFETGETIYPTINYHLMRISLPGSRLCNACPSGI